MLEAWGLRLRCCYHIPIVMALSWNVNPNHRESERYITLFKSVTLSKKNHWMNEDIPWSRCCTVKYLFNDWVFTHINEQGDYLLSDWILLIEQGIYFAAPWPRNILIHSMILFWECTCICHSKIAAVTCKTLKAHRLWFKIICLLITETQNNTLD